MKHTKILLSLISVVLALTMLSGCVINIGKDDEKEKEAEKDQASVTEVVNDENGVEIENNVPENETAAANPVVDSSNNGNAIVSKETFISVIGSLVDLSLYEDLSVTDSADYSTYSYLLKFENRTEYDLNYRIRLDDGTTFTMPVSVAELKGKGWNLIYGSDQILNPGYSASMIMTNADGQEILANIYNDGNARKPLDDCTVIGVQMDQYSSDTLTLNENAPGFTVCGNINEGSGLADIIGTLGNPQSIYCAIHYDDNNQIEYIRVVISYAQPGDAYSNIRFELSGNGDYIASVDYNVAP